MEIVRRMLPSRSVVAPATVTWPASTEGSAELSEAASPCMNSVRRASMAELTCSRVICRASSLFRNTERRTHGRETTCSGPRLVSTR